MEKIKNFNLADIKIHEIVFVATSDPDYEMNKVILVEENHKDFLLVFGWHCSCYGFDDSEWEAIKYDPKELEKVMLGWVESGDGAEKIIAPLILKHLERY